MLHSEIHPVVAHIPEAVQHDGLELLDRCRAVAGISIDAASPLRLWQGPSCSCETIKLRHSHQAASELVAAVGRPEEAIRCSRRVLNTDACPGQRVRRTLEPQL